MLGISIHAPSRERLSVTLHVRPLVTNFNPRSLAGATYFLIKHSLLTENFNPRSLAGATVYNYYAIARHQVFQSTLPRGSDNLENLKGGLKHISIHAPSRERLWDALYNLKGLLFQSTLPRGSDNNYYPVIRIHINFNPRSLAGATNDKTCRKCCFKFQSTLPRGSDGKH